jgi:DNA-nicking Smr family endonuclease
MLQLEARTGNEPALRAHIIAVSPARPEHGGAGAVYVLLKRKR